MGRGLVASLLGDMGYATVADLRAVETEDAMCDFIRRAQRSVDRLRSFESTPPRDWGRIARKAYRVLLAVRAADLSDTGDVPTAFRCPLTLDWMEDPVITQDGHTFDRASIVPWARAVGGTTPSRGVRCGSRI